MNLKCNKFRVTCNNWLYFMLKFVGKLKRDNFIIGIVNGELYYVKNRKFSSIWRKPRKEQRGNTIHSNTFEQ